MTSAFFFFSCLDVHFLLTNFKRFNLSLHCCIRKLPLYTGQLPGPERHDHCAKHGNAATSVLIKVLTDPQVV